ncbi:MAG TPA: hypothetical protein VFQ90_11885, partial [Stellaceae bacterium]|nr:hypothetical protein [Stellaceae bacterium]
GQPAAAGDKNAVLVPFRAGAGPASRSYDGYDSQQFASSPSGYPTQQEAADAIDGAAPAGPTGALPVSRASSPMMPVNARPARLMTGTGGLY